MVLLSLLPVHSSDDVIIATKIQRWKIVMQLYFNRFFVVLFFFVHSVNRKHFYKTRVRPDSGISDHLRSRRKLTVDHVPGYSDLTLINCLFENMRNWWINSYAMNGNLDGIWIRRLWIRRLPVRSALIPTDHGITIIVHLEMRMSKWTG